MEKIEDPHATASQVAKAELRQVPLIEGPQLEDLIMAVSPILIAIVGFTAVVLIFRLLQSFMSQDHA